MELCRVLEALQSKFREVLDMKIKENAVARNRNDVALENNFMFTTVMKNKKACIRLLEAIFGDEHRIADIRYARHPEAEKSILSDPMRRGVRLDVYFDDGKNGVRHRTAAYVDHGPRPKGKAVFLLHGHSHAGQGRGLWEHEDKLCDIPVHVRSVCKRREGLQVLHDVRGRPRLATWGP